MAIGVALVVITMIVYYHFSGVLAVGGLALYVLCTLAVLRMHRAHLPLGESGERSVKERPSAISIRWTCQCLARAMQRQ